MTKAPTAFALAFVNAVAKRSSVVLTNKGITSTLPIERRIIANALDGVGEKQMERCK